MVVLIALLIVIGWGFLGAAHIVWTEAPDPHDPAARRNRFLISGFCAATGICIFAGCAWAVL